MINRSISLSGTDKLKEVDSNESFNKGLLQALILHVHSKYVVLI